MKAIEILNEVYLLEELILNESIVDDLEFRTRLEDIAGNYVESIPDEHSFAELRKMFVKKGKELFNSKQLSSLPDNEKQDLYKFFIQSCLDIVHYQFADNN